MLFSSLYRGEQGGTSARLALQSSVCIREHTMKSHYQAVVIGGGVVGASVLYHLAKFGWKETVPPALDAEGWQDEDYTNVPLNSTSI